MKIKEGDKIYPIITGDDVIITKGVNHPGKTVDEAFEDVDETLDEHKKKISRLESNMKYLYSYGGVGGTGKGGSGGGSTGDPILFVSLNGRQIQSGSDNIIILNSSNNEYVLEGSVSNNGGETFFVDIEYGPNKNRKLSFTLNSDNRWKISSTILKLNTNGSISINFSNSEGSILSQINQTYIVTPHTFTSKFMYEFEDGSGRKQESEFTPYEYFIGNTSQNNPFICISFKIDILNVTHIQVKYDIAGTEGTDNTISYESISDDNPITTGHGIVSFNTLNITNKPLKIYLDNLTRNGVKFTDESNNGTYTVSGEFSYTVNGTEQPPQPFSFNITLIPNNLYIFVSNPQGIMYDTIKDIENACRVGTNGIPEKHINIGSYTSFHCKIFEGPMENDAMRYYLEFYSYDFVDSDSDSDSEPDHFVQGYYDNTSNAIEQVTINPPFSVAFQSKGIKKLEFKTSGKKRPGQATTVKYIYVNEPEYTIKDWYPQGIDQNTYYFRANDSTNIDSDYLRNLQPFETSEKNRPITITGWGSGDQSRSTTILSLGIQYSAVNKDGANILEAYAPLSNTPIISLYSNKLFDIESGGESDKKICIPGETNFNKSVSEQYHLVQIVRHCVGRVGSQKKYVSYLYIDGKLESNKSAIDNNPLRIEKIVFNNVNAVYNLINIQYINLAEPSTLIGNIDKPNILTIDEIIYQYYLAYKDIMGAGTVSDAELTIFNNMSSIKFDGTNVIVDYEFVKTVSPDIPIPTMMMEYVPNQSIPGDAQNFIDSLFRGYNTGSNDFGNKDILLHWCNGSGSKLEENPIGPPDIIRDAENTDVYTATWYVALQGTSTMRNRIKNFSLGLKTTSSTGGTKHILMSPNYDPTDSSTFLPEEIWTLKADIADSAHANNTAVGKFVNRVCTKFSSTNGMNDGTEGADEVLPYIKNTLEGFPVLMYFKIGDDVYYLGVYNFNMGRNSQYNLGYHPMADIVSMKKQIQQGKGNSSPFRYSIGYDTLPETLAVGEIQDNHPQYDFHQFQDSILFGGSGTMFGANDKITGAGDDKAAAKGTLRSLVKSVARAGTYCFAAINKTPISSKMGSYIGDEGTSNDCVKRYMYEEYIDERGETKFREYVPDVKWQYRIENNTNQWYDSTNPSSPEEIRQSSISFDNISSIENLLQCISETDIDDYEVPDYHHLDYSSVSEYYTICMAFGLVDSVLKNMNIKSWDGKKCYVAFYDMDCAFGENNTGAENVTYLTASDYWYSPNNNGYIEPVRVHYDFWNEKIGKGFDYPSSYLFAIAKYAQAIYGRYGKTLNRYPQQFWAELRCKDEDATGQNPAQGELRNADYFINKYFSSGIGKIPAYMATLNYQVKYMYYGKKIDSSGTESTESTFIANSSAFNGSRLEKVRDWFNKRLHILDFMFNMQKINIDIGGGYTMPLASDTTLAKVKINPDVIILKDAFTDENRNGAIVECNSRPVNVWAPMNTPFIVSRGSQNQMFLLCEGTGKRNQIRINVTRSEPVKFYGSTEFTDLSMVEPFFTNAFLISTDHLENIVYGGMDVPSIQSGLKIVSASVKNITLNIPTLSGLLEIPSDGLNGQALISLDIHDSGLIGEWTNLKNLKRINISSVNSYDGYINIAECPITGGDDCVISGKDANNLTTLRMLEMSGISGDYNLKNTSIEKISFTTTKGQDATFEISGDKRLTELKLTGFKKVVIRECPNLQTLYIDEHPGTSVCETIIIDIDKYTNPDGTPQNKLKFFNSDVDVNGVYDFTKYESLQTLGFSGCEPAIVIKMPNHKVSIDTFKNNENLEFIDTCGPNSCIVLTKDSTFYNSPKYGMLQSWYSSENNTEDVDIRTSIGDPQVCNKHTKMCISETCTTLANTFDKVDSGISTSYPKKTNKTGFYTNVWGQKVYNKPIELADARWFIEDVVGGRKIDDAYIYYDGKDENEEDIYRVHDTSTTKTDFGEDCQANITSLSHCFNMQNQISYISINSSAPRLCAIGSETTGYVSLNDISYMYYNSTPSITYISSDLLSLPEENNDSDHELRWEWFTGMRTNLNITIDAFKNISYRINGLTNMNLTICTNKPSNLYSSDEDHRIDIVDILCPHTDEYGEIIPFTRIKEIDDFSVDSRHWVDYTHLFEVCPQVESVGRFLNNIDLSRAKIDGLLKPCTNLVNVFDSFNHSGDVSELTPIDLYEFFNWSDGEGNYPLSNKIKKLFESSTKQDVGFTINKYISQVHFEELMNSFHNYVDINRLSNIFSYCTITDYDPTYEINLGNDVVMSKITNINSLFYKCKAQNNGNDVPLRIRRSLFKGLPSVTEMANTFYGVKFDHMLSYDFFCKRQEYTDPNIFVDDNGYKSAVLHTYRYSTFEIVDMTNCFKDVKFVNCKSWFDPEDDVNTDLEAVKDTVSYNGDDSLTEYYRLEGNVYVRYNISEPKSVMDTKNNYTNYVSTVNIKVSSVKINNHDIESDLNLFGNMQGTWRPYVKNNVNIYPTYCCLPPDIFYGCRYNCSLKNIFSNTNIIGVIPQHLIEKCYGDNILNNMFENVNILPNLIYSYDKRLNQSYIDSLPTTTPTEIEYKDSCIANRSEYLDLISSIDIDNDTIITPKGVDDSIVYSLDGNVNDRDDAIVLFRNTDGELKRRLPILNGSEDPNGEYGKSQFVYVPQGYATNRTLDEAFTFRYNLPQHVDLIQNVLREEGITWNGGLYGKEYSPIQKPWLWPYHIQYFLTVDESIVWNNIDSMNKPFITESQDVDYKWNPIVESYETRSFSTIDRNYTNRWWDEYENVTNGTWDTRTVSNMGNIFNCFLNLCGERDTRTGKINDCGCLISRAIRNNPKIDTFISGPLVVFLSGKVFDGGTDAGIFTSNNASSIIIYNLGFGRNIEFPQLYVPQSDTKYKVLLSYTQSNSRFNNFMFIDGSIPSYKELYNNIDQIITTNISKYRVS